MLQARLLTHSTELPFSCGMQGCGSKTKYKTYLPLYVRRFHSGERPYECPSGGCNFKAISKGDLNSHFKIHSNEKPFACTMPGCDYTCKTKQYLKLHTARAHSDEKPFKCSTCDFRTKGRSDIVQHQFTHTKIKRFKCQAPNCGFASHQRYKFQRHFDTKHRKKHISCTVRGCKYRRSSIHLLQVHIKRCEVPMLKCPADSCSFHAKRKDGLLRHISRRHEGLKTAMVVVPRKLDEQTAGTTPEAETLLRCFPSCGYHTDFPHLFDRHRIAHDEGAKRKYVCAFCFSRFRRLDHRNSHVQRHIGERPYSCSHCKYTAVDGFELRTHARKNHHIHVLPRGKEDEVRKCRTCGRKCLSYSEFVLHSMNHLKPVVAVERLRVHVM